MLAMKHFLIKNCLAVISLSTVSASLFAMDFICGEYGSSEKNLKYSTCSWTSAIHFSAKKLTGKPGQNDMLWIREGGYHLDIDRDLQRERLEQREQPESLKMFVEKWLPLEENYFEAQNPKEKADIVKRKSLGI